MGKYDPMVEEDQTVGTLRYMAPELMVGGRCAASRKTDIWALGMTILEVGHLSWLLSTLKLTIPPATSVDRHSEDAIS